MKHPLTAVSIAVWLALMAALVQRERSASARRLEVEPAGAAQRATARDEWFGMYQEGRKIGFAHRSLRKTPGGFRLRDDSAMRLKVLGRDQQVRTSLEAKTDRSLTLRSFEFEMASEAGRFTVRGEVLPDVRGDAHGGRLRIDFGNGGARKRREIALDQPIQLPATWRVQVAGRWPAPGERFEAPVFSPLALRPEPLTIEVEAHERIAGPDGPVEALRVREKHQGLEARAWLARDGSSLREEAALGFTLIREKEERATAGLDRTAPPDLVLASRIPLSGRIAEPRSLARLRLRVRGAAEALVPAFPPRQRRRGDLVEIAREPPPLAGRGPLAVPPALERFLEPGPFVEADDPAIRQRADAILGGERDPAAAARALVGWVHGHMRPEPSLSVPSAREVLRSLRGDCNEHAVLLAALARAAGIPARVVAGAVYADGAFAYHAWNELWLGRWVSADAVFGQLPADATHLKLVEGGPEKHLALARLLGRIDLERVEPDA